MSDAAAVNNAGQRVWWYALPGMLLVLAVLRFYPLAQMNYSGLLVVVLLLAWLSYHYLAPLRLISRHALLSHVTASDSVLRRLLWNSVLLKFRLVLSALVISLMVLSVASGLSALEWWVLLAGIPVFIAGVHLAGHFSGTESSEQYHFPFSVRMAQWLTVAVVTAILVVVNLFWSDVADTRSLSWQAVVQQSYAAQAADAAIREVGWLLGASAAANELGWHLMQNASSSLAAPFAMKVSAWCVFLLITALKAGLIWVMLGGVLMLVAEQRSSSTPLLGGSAFSRSFSISMLVLFVVYLLLTQLNVGSYLSGTPPRPLPGLITDPCERLAPLQAQQLRLQTGQILGLQQAQILARLEQQIDQQLDSAFVLAESGVERFLDWNFSLKGQYAQLMYMGASAVGERTFADYVAGKMDEHVGDMLTPMLLSIDDDLQQGFMSEMQALYDQQSALLDSLMQTASCLNVTAPSLSLTEYMNKSPVGAGSGAGVLAARASMRVGSRVVSRTASRRVISSTFARLSGRAASGMAAGATGALCGPLVWVCAPALAVGAWLVTDLAINEVDQAMNRDDMRQDMMAVLQEERDVLAQQMKQHYAWLLSDAVHEIEQYQEQRFNILRDGV